jgi:hypothetical protein
MNIKITASIYSIIMGTAMIGAWAAFYVQDAIPELYTKPTEISMHIIAEIVTALLLITGGIGLMKSKSWGFRLYLISIGMLQYTLISSSGYFAQQGECIITAMFACFIALTAVLIGLSLLKEHAFK